MDPVIPENPKKADKSLMENNDLSIMPDNPAPKTAENSTIQNPEPKVEAKKEEAKPAESFEVKPKEPIKKVEQEKAKPINVEENVVVKDEEKPLETSVPQQRSLAVAILKTLSILIAGAGVFVISVFILNFVSHQPDALFDDRFLVEIPSGSAIEMYIEDEVFSVKNVYEIKGGEVFKTKATSGVTINLPSRGLLRLDEETELVIGEFDKEASKYLLTLNEGNLWGDLLNNFFELRVVSGEVAVIPSLSLFNIENKGDRTKIYAQKHDVLVEILANDKVINKLWIAEGNQAQFPNIKIVQEAETIEQLLYSKLVKEFNYGRVSTSTIEDNSWVINSIQEAENRITSIEDSFEKNIRDAGLANLSEESLRYQTKEIVADLRKALTFSDVKKAKSIISNIFENIDDAAFLYMQGSKVDALVRLKLFEVDINDVSLIAEDEAENLLKQELAAYLQDYITFSPSHALYPVKEALFKEVFDTDVNFNLLTLKLNDVYDVLNEGTNEADKILADYFSFYEKIVRKHRIKGIDAIQDEIERQNILLDNLLFLYPDVYKLKIFESKRKVEDDYLNSIKGARDKKEQRQTFISEKINLLNKIEEFLFAEALDPVDARQIVFQLITDMEEYRMDTLDAAAINDLFERRLADFGLFWEYLKSDEYATTPLHGDTHLKRFAAFTEIQEKNVTFEDIREEILGTQVEEVVTTDEILEQAEQAFIEAGIEDTVFGFYTDVNDNKIPIVSATVSGIDFAGIYDWDRGLVSNIVVGAEIISQEGLKLSKTKTFIIDFIAEKSRPEVVIEDLGIVERATSEDEIIKAAKVFVSEKFDKAGIQVDYKLIQIVSLNEGIYRVEDVFFTKNKTAKFSFDYLNKIDKVTNVVIPTKSGKTRTIKDTFSLTFLDDVVLKIYEGE